MNKDITIEHIQRASKELLKHLNLLNTQFSTIGSISQCHALMELNTYKTMNIQQLSERLNLEKSTVSRMVIQLVDKDICQVQTNKENYRDKLISLTPKGFELFRKIDTESYLKMHQALSLINQKELTTLTQGLLLYNQALTRYHLKADSTIRKLLKKDLPKIRRFCKTIQVDPHRETSHTTSLLRVDYDEILKLSMTTRSNYFLIEYNKEIIGGCGYSQLSSMDSDICVIRCLYFPPYARGLGIFLRLMEIIFHYAKSDGFKQCFSEDHDFMQEKSAFYKILGFKKSNNLPAHSKQSTTHDWYVKEL